MNTSEIIKGVNSGELIIAKKCDLENLFRQVIAEKNQERKKGLMSRGEVKKILALKGDSAFDRLLQKPECLIRRSQIQGKYIAQSVYDEIDRQGR